MQRKVKKVLRGPDIFPTTKISAMHLLLYSRYSLLAAALQGISLQKLPVFSNAFLSLKQLTTIYLLQQPQTVTQTHISRRCSLLTHNAESCQGCGVSQSVAICLIFT